MKLLLINTPIQHEEILGDFKGIYDDLKMIPIGISYLAAVARQNKIEVEILDQYAEDLSIAEILARVDKFQPDLIGYGATTPNYHAAINLLRNIRGHFPEIKTVMGGQHPSIFPTETLANPEVDFVIRDEGEKPLVALCKALERDETDFSQIDGLSYKAPGGGFVENRPTGSIDLDSLPWPAYDLLPMELYSSPAYTRFAKPVFQMTASRGCPNKCTYCINAELKIAARYRRRKVDDVIDEMAMLQEKYGAKQVQFWDPIFPLGAKHALEFSRKLIERGLHKKLCWNSTTYAEFLTEEAIVAMATANCKGIGFGIESGVVALLESVNKGSNLEKIRQMCKVARKNGIVVAGAFMIGFPGETREMTRETIEFAKSLDIHYAQFSILTPYPGTPLYRQLLENNEILAGEEEDFVRYNQNVGLTEQQPVFIPHGRKPDELKSMQRRAYREFYLRPKIMWMHLPHIRFSLVSRMLQSFFSILKLTFSKKD